MDNRICTKCGESKPIDAYFRGVGYRDGYRRRCKTCCTKAGNDRQRNHGQRACEKCGATKNASEFHRSRDIYSWCRACCGGSLAKWRAANPVAAEEQQGKRGAAPIPHPGKREYQRAYRLFGRYGLSVAQYDAMCERQGGKCAICGLPPDRNNTRSGTLHVDHCHKTGMVRGLLCWLCNSSLGGFRDERARLLAAIAYLDKHGEVTGPTPSASIDAEGVSYTQLTQPTNRMVSV